MPINPSALPWWGWLLCSVAGFAMCLISMRDDGKGGFLALIAALGGLIAGAMVVALFVQWVWTGNSAPLS